MAAIIASVLLNSPFAGKNRRCEEMRIGIPRGLLYYQYFPMWKTFFEAFVDLLERRRRRNYKKQVPV
jgi:predicted nucleotide-binding protein (sugar kinase/HSP70/actin superfamily)